MSEATFDEAAWREGLTEHRERKDEFFAEHPQSPLPHETQRDFDGLDYYPPDPDYRVAATVTLHDDPEVVVMETTTGAEQRYHRLVTLTFDIDGEEVEMAGYRGVDDDEGLFVPFRDATSGSATYGAGRYLEVEAEGHLLDGDTVVVDFNEAYSPFCAYNDAYSCPLPPTENWLDVAIEAGERYDGER